MGFFYRYSQITGLAGISKDISLTPYYYFRPLHRHLDSQAITAENTPPNIGSI